MAINNSKAEREKQANRELAYKLKLENPLKAKFNALFNNMSRDVAAFVSVEGKVPDLSVYDDEIRGILTQSWQKTSKLFSGNLIDKISLEAKDNDSLLEETILAAALFFGLSRSEFISQMKNEVAIARTSLVKRGVESNAKSIIATNAKEVDVAFARAQLSLVESGQALTAQSLAKETASNFSKSALGRTETIAMTNVQQAAEGTKQSESDVVANNLRLRAKKEWLTRGDNKVREAHVEADSQVVNDDEPFIVDGESLMYPSDTSLGASAGNTINCRCSSIPFLDTEEQ